MFLIPDRFRPWMRERTARIADAAVNVRRAYRLVWESHPPTAVAMAVCTLIGAGLPAGQAWVGKLIVDAVVAAIGSDLPAMDELRSVMPLLLVEFGLIVLQAVNNQARSLAEHILHSRLNLSINTRIIRKALELDLSHFENAEYYDKLQNARREADWRGLQIVNGGFY
ncbi:MAG TPA: hypothetical protein VGA32_08220, partial [Anaerolineales bacterium]